MQSKIETSAIAGKPISETWIVSSWKIILFFESFRNEIPFRK
jgi:hypothetical protein